MPAVHHGKGFLKLRIVEAVRENRGQIQPGFHHRHHLVPRFIHLSAVDALQRQPLEDA